MADAMREVVALYWRCRELNAKGAYASAIQLGEEVIQMCRANGLPSRQGEVWRDTWLMNLQFWTDCETKFQAAVAESPRSEAPWILRATALIELDRFEEAILSLENALSLNPESADALWRLGLAKSELAKDGQVDEALGCFNKALELDRNLEAAWYYRAMALSDAGRDEEALASIETLLRLNPGNHFALQLRGILLENLRRFREAQASYALAAQVSRATAG